MTKLLYTISILLCFLSLSTKAHENKDAISGAQKSQLFFVKNEGQWQSPIRYKANLPGGAVFLTADGFMYNFYSVAELKKLHDQRLQKHQNISNEKIDFHAYKMRFEGANTQSFLQEKERQNFYHNYFLGADSKKWKGNVPVFGEITYNSIYNNIDLTIYTKENQLKYDFILNKGANVNDIRLSFDGVLPEITGKGELLLRTSVGDIKESAPITYQTIGGVKKIIPSSYVKINKTTLSFQLGDYDKNYPVIIDPSLVFATYSGSTATTFGFSATYNNQGDLVEAGECFAVGWPVTTGAFQTTFGGQVDIGIDHFNATGTTLLNSTYIGGSNLDQPASLVCDLNMDLYIMAVTESTDFPVSQGCFDSSQNGDMDYAVVHLSNTYGSIIGSTYLGGSNIDGTYGPKGEIYLDNLNNIYIGGCSESADYPVTTGVWQSAIGGIVDGVVSVLNNTCSALIGSTFLGGSQNDKITGIRKMPNGNIAATGTTWSNNYVTTTGAYQPNSFTSGTMIEKGILTVLDAALTNAIASTYIQAPDTTNGTSIQFVDFDKQNNLYVYGYTDTSFPVTTGKYFNAFGGTLVAKFPPALNTITWSTRIGSTTNYFGAISPTAFLVDNCNKIYLAGYGAGMSDYPLTSNAISNNPQGFWIGVLDTNASNLLFGTFFGSAGDHLDGGTSRFDKKGIIYHAVCCGNPNFPTTSTAAYPNRMNTSWDIVGYKLDGGTLSVVALNAASPGLYSCSAPFTINFTNYSQNAAYYFWDFGDGSTDTATNPTHTFNTPGNYNVMLVAIDTTTCNKYDTVYLPVQILSNNFQVVDQDTTVCLSAGATSIQITAQTQFGGNNIIYSWLPNPAIVGSSTNTATITIDPSIDSVFTVIAIDSIPNKCAITDTGTIIVHAIDPSHYYALPDTTIAFCPGQSFQLNTFGDGAYVSYLWVDLSGLNTVSDTNSPTPIIKPQSSTQYIVYFYSTDRSCFITDTVNTAIRPVVDLTSVSPVYLCLHDTVQLSVSAAPSGLNYNIIWKDISGAAPFDFISGESTFTPLVSPKKDRTYTVTVALGNQEYCIGIDTIDVHLYPLANLVVGGDEILRLGESVQLNATGNGTFLWTPDSFLSDPTQNLPYATPPHDMLYHVTVTTAEGCTETDSVKIRITQLAFPNAFSPNGDGLNDVLRLVIMNKNILLEKISIVDRWGKEVFQTNDLEKGWDGNYKDGTYAEVGVYFYYIKYSIGKRSYLDKGDVTLIR